MQNAYPMLVELVNRIFNPRAPRLPSPELLRPEAVFADICHPQDNDQLPYTGSQRHMQPPASPAPSTENQRQSDVQTAPTTAEHRIDCGASADQQAASAGQSEMLDDDSMDSLLADVDTSANCPPLSDLLAELWADPQTEDQFTCNQGSFADLAQRHHQVIAFCVDFDSMILYGLALFWCECSATEAQRSLGMQCVKFSHFLLACE